MKSRQPRRIARPKKDEETYNGWEDLSAAYQGYY